MIRDLFLHNGQIRSSSEQALVAGQVGLFSGWGVFSTIKVMQGVLFAFEKHWARMRKDAEALRVPFPWTPEELKETLLTLVRANQESDATLRVVVVRNGGTMWAGPGVPGEVDLVAFTAARSQWGEAAKLGIVANGRHADGRFSGAKTTSWAMNLVWYEEAHMRGEDEVILLNERGEVSECTSANIFCVRGNEVWTPPLSSGCLPGVTRDLLLTAVKVPGVTVVEKKLTLEDLRSAESVFITSTTRDLLQVAEIGGVSIARQDEVRSRLSEAFSNYQRQYLLDRLQVR